MPPVASSSPDSPSRSRPRKDRFKPKFPLDPFSGHSAAALGEPWFLKIDALLNATAFYRRNIIFVVGAPSLTDLGPLLQSQQLAKSLVILATHNPPDIPGIVYPTVRVLRLTVPLALEDSGAVRFVNVLEWAERVARTWRKHGGAGVVELLEESDINGNGDLKPPSVFRFGSHSTPPSPRSSTTHLTGDASVPPSRPVSRTTSRPSSIVSVLFLNKGSGSLPPPDPSQRPFDALINFLPEKISDKALLKNAILVTTISRPFLKASYGGAASSVRTRAASSSPSSSPRPARPRSIFGAFSRSSSSLSVYIPSTPHNLSKDSLSLSPTSASVYAPPGKALLVHLLPSPRPKETPGTRRRLVDSMETFLLSFSFNSAPGMKTQTPPSSASLRTSTYSPGTATRSVSGVWTDPDSDHARAYLMQTTTFCDSVGVANELTHGPSGSVESGDAGEWTVADIVLSGALDADGSAVVDPLTNSPATSMPTVAGADGPRKRTRRAWIAAAGDLVIVPSAAGDDCSASPSPSPSSSPARAYGQTTPSRTIRSSSAPLLPAEWAPAGSGGRPLSLLHAHSHSPLQLPHSRTETVVQPAAAAVASSSSSSASSSNSTSGGLNQGSTPPPMLASVSSDSTPASSLGPRTPPASDDSGSEHDGAAVDMDTGKTGVGLAVAVNEADRSGGTKGVKAAKWKFWRRKAGADENANATAAEVELGA